MDSVLCLTGLHEDLTARFLWHVLSRFGYVDSVCVQRDSRNRIAFAYAFFADAAHLRMALDVLDQNVILGCQAFAVTETVFRRPRGGFRTGHAGTHANAAAQDYCRICESTTTLLCDDCLTCVDCKIWFPGLPRTCALLDVAVCEDLYRTREALRLAGGPQPPVVPPWITPLAVCGNSDQLQRLIAVDDEADGSDSSGAWATSSGVLQEADGSAASLVPEWIQESAFGAVDPVQPLKSFEESHHELDNPAAAVKVNFADVAAVDVPLVDVRMWEEGFDCPSHTVPCHLGCWNGFPWTLPANSNDSGVADMGDISAPASETSSLAEEIAEHFAHCSYESAYADSMASVADSVAWADCTRVRVCYLKAPNELYLQRVDDDDVIRQMVVDVNLAAETALPLWEPRLGQPCLAFVRNFSRALHSAGTTLWCRAVVETVQSHKVTVLLLDYGKVVSVQGCPWSLRRMSADLARIPLMARRLHAPSVTPYSEGEWSVDAISFARSFSREDTYTLSSAEEVILLSEKNGLDWFAMMQKFEKLKIAQPRLPHIVSSFLGTHCERN